MDNIPDGGLDTLRATVRIEDSAVSLTNPEKWLSGFLQSLKTPGSIVLRVDVQDDQCWLGIMSFENALEPEPDALYIELTHETIGPLCRALKVAKKELKQLELRKTKLRRKR